MHLKEIRKRKGVSQKELAELLGITPSALCQYEKGKRTPKIALLIKISEVFDCTLDELMR